MRGDTEIDHTPDAAESRPLFSVIVVNYNGKDYLPAALASLRKQTMTSFEVILVDNASTDGSADYLDLSGLPGVVTIQNTENLGFTGGVNCALDSARGTYLALLNPDCEAHETWLMELANAVTQHPDVAMFSSTQICQDDANIIDGAGDNYYFAGIPWRGGYGRPIADLPETGDCFSPCGAGAVIKRSVFDAAGGFDEDFFCYCEDVDLGFRLRLLGERCVYWRPAVVTHAGSAISGKDSEFTIYHGTRNRIWTYAKNMPMAALILTTPLHVAASLYFYWRCPGEKRRKAMGKGLLDGWRGLGDIWAKRKHVQKSRKISSFSLLRAMTWHPAKLRQRRTDVRYNRYQRINGQRAAYKASTPEQPLEKTI